LVSAITPPSAPTLSSLGGDSDYWEQRHYGLSLGTWLKVGLLTVLFAALFWSNLWRLWQKTNPFTGEGNWEHAIFIPLLGLYYLYVNSDDLLRRRVEPLKVTDWSRPRWISALCFIGFGAMCYFILPLVGPLQSQAARVEAAGIALMGWGLLALAVNWGIATTIFGIILFAYGIWPGMNDYVKDVGMVITLFGVVLTLCGWDVMKVAWFPIAFLIFALPWPGLVYSWVAMPLQEIAAKVSVGVLQLTGVQAQVMGTKIMMSGHGGEVRTLNVAEACAGLKSLMTFLTVGAAMAFLSARPLWQKIIMTASAVPIAIGCNTMRVAGQGLLDFYWSREISQGFAHQFSGLIMLIPAFFLLLLVGWILDKLFIEEVDDKASLVAQAQTSHVGSGSGAVIAPPPPSGAPRRQAPVIIAPPPPAGGSLRPRKPQAQE
jgi:exosortase